MIPFHLEQTEQHEVKRDNVCQETRTRYPEKGDSYMSVKGRRNSHPEKGRRHYTAARCERLYKGKREKGTRRIGE